jgi:hypothetical protein
MQQIQIRLIDKNDNKVLASIIRNALKEFGILQLTLEDAEYVLSLRLDI